MSSPLLPNPSSPTSISSSSEPSSTSFPLPQAFVEVNRMELAASLHVMMASLQQKIEELQKQLAVERQAKEELQSKYVADLEARDKEHQEKIEKVKKQVKELKKKLAERNNEMKELKGQLAERDKEMKELKGQLAERDIQRDEEIEKLTASMNKFARDLKRQRWLLLCGSVAYTYIRSAIEFIFQGRGKKSIQNLQRALSTFDEIEEAATSEDERARLDNFKKYYDEAYDQVLQLFKEKRVTIAHPTTEDDEEESEVVLPDRMRIIIGELYQQRANRKIRDVAQRLVDSLDQLRRDLGKEALLE